MSPLSRAWHLCIVSYIAASVLYTTSFLVIYLFGAPLKAAIELGLPSGSPLWVAKETGERTTNPSNGDAFSDGQRIPSVLESPGGYNIDSDMFSVNLWQQTNVSHRNGAFDLERTLSAEQQLVFSKAFATSMNPTKIVPYFYKASGPFEQDDVTITSIITSNRLDVFARLVARYQGPISVTLHVKNTTSELTRVLGQLRKAYSSSDLMSRYVDVHLVVDSFERQFNTWRNIARLFARTDYILMLDVDFYLCTDFRASLNKNPWIKRQLESGMAAMVIPAFEFTGFEEGKDPSNFPETKKDLLKLVKRGRIDMFHAGWKPGHNSTDYPRFYSASPGEIYQVKEYQSAYEPYVILKKNGPPWCEERFVGYGGNKAACLFEMYLAGVTYYVLSDHFLIHQNHLYEETARRTERKYNRKIYAGFKEEVCFRYLRSYRDTGLLNTTRARNAVAECKKLKPIRISAPQLLGD
ncbi:glycosyl-transferase for dystroglycan-domain-containing protein [Ephemerocybe angulata]|uniref:Glycosyl-transferase for dystroglycan-domain-containing protein n=1 Tax=Ephemerocybe angulata TaxID=980116 RepID=A0A8H6MEP9_9AGAR|nr:glycosyl-transferase for dystroglycan-domain-containing protein [Tulosesus angulatus]